MNRQLDGPHNAWMSWAAISRFGYLSICLLFYAIATIFQLYHGGNMMYEMRRRKPEPPLLPTQWIFNLPHHGMRGTGLWWRCKLNTPGSPTQCLNQLSYFSTPAALKAFQINLIECDAATGNDVQQFDVHAIIYLKVTFTPLMSSGWFTGRRGLRFQTRVAGLPAATCICFLSVIQGAQYVGQVT